MFLRSFIVLCAVAILIAVPGMATAQNSDMRLAPKAVAEFHTGTELVWQDDAAYTALIQAIEGLSSEGLNPEHYHLARLKTLQNDKTARDKLASDAWFSAAAHMVYGKLDPKLVEPDWTASKRQIDLKARLSDVLKNGSIASSLSDLAPTQNSYGLMKAELANLRNLSVQSQTKIEAGTALKSGMSGKRVTQLQTRLTELGLLTSEDISGTFSEKTKQAVIDFQYRSELDDDGIAGAATLAAMNRDLSEKIDRVRVNMERARWLPDNLGRRHVRVNIAEFKVTAWNEGKVERTHLGIVGKAFRKTPVFSDQFEYMVFNPWWETPHKLARLDKLPSFQKDPNNVKRLGFQVLDSSGKVVNPDTIDWNNYSATHFPFRIRQGPGELNALGQVKMMFPNEHAVYLHDTPTRGLFASRQRAFSSGCIRTQDPIDLSEWLLSETPNWDRAAIDAAIASGKETRANMSKPVPVHILYNTVTVDLDGSLRYLDDIYDRDGKVLAGLKTAPK